MRDKLLLILAISLIGLQGCTDGLKFDRAMSRPKYEQPVKTPPTQQDANHSHDM